MVLVCGCYLDYWANSLLLYFLLETERDHLTKMTLITTLRSLVIDMPVEFTTTQTSKHSCASFLEGQVVSPLHSCCGIVPHGSFLFNPGLRLYCVLMKHHYTLTASISLLIRKVLWLQICYQSFLQLRIKTNMDPFFFLN